MMSKYVNLLYLFFILLFVVFIQIGIRTGQRPDMKVEADSSGFKPMAQKIKEGKRRIKKAEEEVIQSIPDEKHQAMVLITAGAFIMGDNEGHLDQQPEREVYLDGFFIDQYETTFAQFYSFVTAAGHRKPRLAGYLAVDSTELHLLMKPSNPVVGVSWYDAQAYCEWMGKRLPTEAEWEKAAGGIHSIKWPWGNEEKSSFSNLVGRGDGFAYLSPVGALTRDHSPYGIYDMAGNVMEWVWDWYQEDYYHTASVNNPTGPGSSGYKVGPGGVAFGKYRGGAFKVVRGASWNDSIKRAQTAIRFKTYPTYRDVTIGFRCVKNG